MEQVGVIGRIRRPLRGVVALVFLTGCGGPHDSTGTPAEPSPSQDPPGVETLQQAWQLVSLREAGGTAETVFGVDLVADFGEDGNLFIEADCNVCSAAYRADDDGTLEILGPVPCTLAYCPSAPLDTRFLRGLEGARSWSIDEGTLQLSSPDGGILLLQRRQS
jgi:heat shock protein HslJ